ncbi:hypothetical protein TcBrA4_0041300 [Trypanosoma cruzi]|nr:hypothetical protein TcBrA4_0041300 [Trypanosoma cruzi]
MQFMTANLIRGWFQRMEHVRKYAFGVALIIGEERRHDIVALWVFRGSGMPAIVRDVEDTELFDWEEVADVAAPPGAHHGLPVLGGPDRSQACAGGPRVGVRGLRRGSRGNNS